MRTLYLDCIGGIAGDMMLAGLIEAGVAEEELLDALRALPVSGWEWRSERVEVGAIFARRVHIQSHADQPHRHLSDVQAIIESAALAPTVKQRALTVFHKLAEAEARVHGTTADRIHFHEVGAVDAILDVVGTCWAIERLGVERIVCSPLPMGRGFVKAEHGNLPIPAPAVVELLRGVPTYGIAVHGETVTPTGAALAVALADEFGVQPPMRWEAVGYGTGHAVRPLPNLLRVFVGEGWGPPESEGHWHSVAHIETQVDDANPQLLGYLMERAFAEGAVDAFFTPIQMKKNRPAVLITLLAPPERAESLINMLFQETPTLGVRYTMQARRCLPRTSQTVQTPYGTVRIKQARVGERVYGTPEYDDCVQIARAHHLPLREVMRVAQRAWEHEQATEIAHSEQ